MGVCQLLTGMILQVLLGGGNSNIFGIFTPIPGKDEPILTSIFFKWVGSTTNQNYIHISWCSGFLDFFAVKIPSPSPRNAYNYTVTMSACEKADRWQVALELFQAKFVFLLVSGGKCMEMLYSCWEIARGFVADGIIMENDGILFENDLTSTRKEDSILESRYEVSTKVIQLQSLLGCELIHPRMQVFHVVLVAVSSPGWGRNSRRIPNHTSCLTKLNDSDKRLHINFCCWWFFLRILPWDSSLWKKHHLGDYVLFFQRFKANLR